MEPAVLAIGVAVASRSVGISSFVTPQGPKYPTLATRVNEHASTDFLVEFVGLSLSNL